jgi:hypothetical protein
MDPYAPTYLPPIEPPDPGKGARILVAVVEFILAGFCLLLLPFVVLMASFATTMPVDQRPATSGLAMSAVVYLAGAAFFITMGIGTIRARRWARALMVVASALGLTGGVAACVAVILLLPRVLSGSSRGGAALPGPATFIVLVLVLGIVFTIYVLLPGGFLAYYVRPSIREEFERLDPEVRWTDLCPLPVLAVALVLGYSGVASILTALAGSALPLFGTVVKGPAMIPLGLLLAAAYAFAGWKTYHLEMVGWWSAVGMMLFWGASFVVTLLVLPPDRLFAAMGVPATQTSSMDDLGLTRMMLPLMVLSVLLMLGYLAYVRRFFLLKTAAHSDTPLG